VDDRLTPARTSPEELDLTESRALRDRNIARTEVLDKVKALALLPGDTYATTELVADFYEVDAETVKKTVQRSLDELTSDGFRVLRGDELRDMKSLGGISSRTPGLAVFPRRAILRVGMLLRDSEIAKRVRTHLLDTERPAIAVPSYAEALRGWAAEIEAREHVQAQLEAAKPKADAFDTYLATEQDPDILRIVAKTLGMPEKTLRRTLLDAGLIFWSRTSTACGRAEYEPYAQYGPTGTGLFAVKRTTVTHTWGECVHQTVTVTPKGVEYIRRLLASVETGEDR
jgi:phage antirepressor YoqD-like protein